ncbi:MAG TPA: hypothetical protein ENN66_07350 [Proteobacteria bacterium]|nr:hypothetical protein [Pseudomonadota bacterium]
MASIIVLCKQKPLASFLKAELSLYGVGAIALAEVEKLSALVSEPGVRAVILVPESENDPLESHPLRKFLQEVNDDLAVVGILPPDAAEDVFPCRLPDDNLLRLPFSGAELRLFLQRITGIRFAAKEIYQEKETMMAKSGDASVKILELTEIVDEGLPLDELPDMSEAETPVSPAPLAGGGEGREEESVGGQDVAASDLDEDFSAMELFDSLAEDDLIAIAAERDFDDKRQVKAEASGKLQPVTEADFDTLLPAEEFADLELEAEPEAEDLTLRELKNAGLTLEVDASNETSSASENRAEGDGRTVGLSVEDELMDLDDLLKELETEPAPRTRQIKTTAVTGSATTNGVEADFSAIPSMAPGSEAAACEAAGATANAPQTTVAEVAAETPDKEAVTRAAFDPEKLVSEERDAETDFMVSAVAVEDGSSEEENRSEPDLLDNGLMQADAAFDVEVQDEVAEASAVAVEDEGLAEPLTSLSAEEQVGTMAASGEPAAAAESPEDYLWGDDLAENRKVDMFKRRPLSPEPEVWPEPVNDDFSRQIESLTREWSKQLLKTTYSSMDKMIKAIGDLAPTIVDQVAREVIPPLAEKVIKAEIARLEKKLENEADEEESPAGQ